MNQALYAHMNNKRKMKKKKALSSNPSTANNKEILPSVVMHVCNSSNQEVEAEGSQVQDQPELYHEIQSQKIVTNQK
jgi:hypothetical protein